MKGVSWIMIMGLRMLILAVPAVGIILLQIFLSKRDGKWFGLILPAISFLLSLLLVIAIVAYTNIGITSHSISENGIVVTHTIEDTRPAFGATAGQAVITFLLSNIPTLVFITIYASCREKRKREPEK